MTEQDHLELFERRLRAAFAQVPSPARRPVDRPAEQPPQRRRHPRRLALVAQLAGAAILALVAALLPWQVVTPHKQVPIAKRPQQAAVWQGHGLVITAHAASAPPVCRLPVSVLATGVSGFVQLGNGAPTFTPASGSGTYVPAMNTWADVLPQEVAPGGDAYVEVIPAFGPQAHNTFRIVRADGTSSTIEPPQPLANVVAWTREGILVTSLETNNYPPTSRAWLLDPATGALQPVPFTLASSVGEYVPADDSLWGYLPAGASPLGPFRAAPPCGPVASPSSPRAWRPEPCRVGSPVARLGCL